VLDNERGLWVTLLAPPISTRRPGVVPFRQTVTDCQPCGVSQEAVLVSAICQVVLSPTNAMFLPWDGAEEKRGAPERGCHLFSFPPLSLSFLCYRSKREHLSFWIFSWWRLSWRMPHLSRECHSRKLETAPRGQNEFIHAVNPTILPALLSGADILHTCAYTRVCVGLQGIIGDRKKQWDWTPVFCVLYVILLNLNSFAESKPPWLTV